MLENLPSILFFAVWGLALVLILVRKAGRFVGPVRKSRAEVIHKQTVEGYSKYSGKTVRYAVTFLVGGRRKSFFVSQLSYEGYRVGEKGMLTYRGDRLMDFC